MKKAQPTISGMRMRSRGWAVIGNGAPASLIAAVMIEENGRPIGITFLRAMRRRQQKPPRQRSGEDREITTAIDGALIEKWALAHLGRYASSAENLRRVLQRRVRRRLAGDDEAVRAAGATIDALVALYRASGLLDDAAYAAVRARSGLARARSL